ncbi:MAG: hypothetical protein M3Q19_01630 [Pseudomonadota bacterium]|nr:hypothetical protein [Pseudomonadota bacterium]
MGCPSRVRPYPHISAQSVNNPLVDLGCAAAICRIVPWNRPAKSIKGMAGGNAAENGANFSMLTARVTYGLGGLLLVNVVLLAAQMVVGVNYLPI